MNQDERLAELEAEARSLGIDTGGSLSSPEEEPSFWSMDAAKDRTYQAAKGTLKGIGGGALGLAADLPLTLLNWVAPQSNENLQPKWTSRYKELID